jgi:hypothetical protein
MFTAQRIINIFRISVLLVTTVVVLQPTPAKAIPCQAVITDFFTDSGCTNYVGERTVDCESESCNDGTCSAPYRIEYFGFCCGDCQACSPEGSSGCIPS